MNRDRILQTTGRRLPTAVRTGLPGALLVFVLALAGGCQDVRRPLQVSGLTPAERLYVERVVAMERAKSVALVDREAGEALLDSLSAAWGDSAAIVTARGLAGDPTHARVFSELLLGIVSAEQDSLLLVPGRNRLHLPLPPPAAAPRIPTGD